jgi:hypothetical protein
MPLVTPQSRASFFSFGRQFSVGAFGRVRTTRLPSMKSRGELFEVQNIQQTD